MPKIEYVPKNFSADRLQMIEKVNGVVATFPSPKCGRPLGDFAGGRKRASTSSFCTSEITIQAERI